MMTGFAYFLMPTPLDADKDEHFPKEPLWTLGEGHKFYPKFLFKTATASIIDADKEFTSFYGAAPFKNICTLPMRFYNPLKTA